MKVYMGYAKADITPSKSEELIGFARPDNMSKGVLHHLEAQVVTIGSSEETDTIIAIDSIGYGELGGNRRGNPKEVVKHQNQYIENENR